MGEIGILRREVNDILSHLPRIIRIVDNPVDLNLVIIESEFPDKLFKVSVLLYTHYFLSTCFRRRSSLFLPKLQYHISFIFFFSVLFVLSPMFIIIFHFHSQVLFKSPLCIYLDLGEIFATVEINKEEDWR